MHNTTQMNFFAILHVFKITDFAIFLSLHIPRKYCPNQNRKNVEVEDRIELGKKYIEKSRLKSSALS